MSESLIALTILILSFFPSFSQKNNFENSLKERFLVQSKKEDAPGTPGITIPEKNILAETSASASSALFVDMATGEVLFAKNADKKLPMASTTKLMTAIIALEKLDKNEVVTVPNIATRPLDSIVGLSPGERIKTSELVHGLLIESGSDAALTLSTRIAGDENKFAAIMNEEAQILGLTNTQFTNSVGYDDNSHYSTAQDLIKLARIALSNKEIAGVVEKRSYTLRTEDGKGYYLSNTNKLLGSNYRGIKTGTTFAAGECLISLYKEGNREIIGVVLGSPDRFNETINIIEWAKNSFVW